MFKVNRFAKLNFTFFFLTLIYFSLAQESLFKNFGKERLSYVSRDSSFSVNFSPLIQIQSSINRSGISKAHSEQLDFKFLIRRTRIKLDGWAYSPKLKYKLQLGLSNRDVGSANKFTNNRSGLILDAVVKWNFYKNAEFWFGQTVIPGNLEFLVSSGSFQLIDRSPLNSKFTLGRDLGVQLHNKSWVGKNFLFKQKFAISQGEGRDITAGNAGGLRDGGLQYTGRLEFFPFGEFKSKGEYSQGDLVREKSSKLMIGFTYNHNNRAVKTRGSQGRYLINSLLNTFVYADINTIFVDAMFKFDGISAMIEFAKRDKYNLSVNNKAINKSIEVGTSLNCQIGYLLKNNMEIVGRYTINNFDYKVLAKDLSQFTVGVSKYLVGHKLKIQSDASFISLDGKYDSFELRAGINLQF